MLKREHWLRDLKQNLETSIQNAPLGNLKIINCRGVEQYYLDSAETRTSYPNGKYLRKSDFELAGKLAQRNYDEKLLSEVEKQLKNIRNYSAPRLGYINFWSKQRKYNFCFIIALLRKVDNFSM